jgi:alkylation response protein AidB-like acyl-CoA dehydrogenase
MDFELGPEEQAFEREVEAFLREHASPDVMDSHPEQLSQTVDTPAKRAFMAKLAERGWLGMSWPKAYGGQEKPGIYDYVLTEALSRWGAPQPGKGVGIVGKTIIRHGSERMKREFLPRIMRGEIEFAIGYSEPGAGSDAAAGGSTGRRSGPPRRTSPTSTGWAPAPMPRRRSTRASACS